MFHRFSKAVALMALVSLTGCASIVSKSEWPVTIQSNPTGAKCVISKENGVSIQVGETPMTVTLSSSKGYFSKAEYKLVCNKEGYQASEAEFKAHINGWYLGGNLVFGGLIGYLIVDPATGAMWRLDETTTVNLLSAGAKTADASPAPKAIQ
ncbi:hypothetical protein [Geomesophilobacter sediminis]|uniref:PEGA domain-containing protein n=1 Tax=Geomesophilobacter sediminis TaxID=2798584 RepID=A0A8J7IQJ3_9BACT|nr:hypothetical protein [Geomesophilobacter sediminis]MBJ6724924.1 hypothetical protein [Geomesophilobacter sediminis]